MFKEKKIYMLRDIFGNIWTFTMDHRLNYEIRNNKNTKIHSAILSSNASNDFVVNIGVRNDIHLVLKTNNGDVLYYFFNGKKWAKVKLFNIPQNIDFFQLLGLYIWDNRSHILYCIQSHSGEDKWHIIDQYWEDGKWNHMKILDSEVHPSVLEFSSTQDHHGNIFFACQTLARDAHYLQFSQFDRKVGLWSRNALSFKKGDMYAPDILASNSKLFVIWVSQEEDSFSLCLRIKYLSESEGSHWSKERSLYSSSSKIQHPFLFEKNGTIKILWIERDKLLSIESRDEGNTWNMDRNPIKLRNPTLCFFISNSKKMNCPYLILDGEDKTYPFELYEQEVDSDIPNSEEFFYPSSLTKETIRSNNANLDIEKAGIDRIPSSVPNPSNVSISLDALCSLDDSTIMDLSEDKTKVYLKIFRDQLAKLYNELQTLKNQKTKRSSPPPIYNRQNRVIENKNMMKEQLRSRIIEKENIDLKSEVSEYRNTLEDLQLDIKKLRDEIRYMDEQNKRLQDEILKIKDHSIITRITKFFMEE